MNTLPMISDGWQAILDAPLWALLLTKATAILLAAWLAHLALARTNPCWRVLLWRVAAVGLIALPAVAWLLPAVTIHVQQPPRVEEATVISMASQQLPSPGTDRRVVGTEAGGEGGVVVMGNHSTCFPLQALSLVR